MLNFRGSAPPGRFFGGGLPCALRVPGGVKGVKGPCELNGVCCCACCANGPPPRGVVRRAPSVTGEVKGVWGGTRLGPPEADPDADGPAPPPPPPRDVGLLCFPGSVNEAGSKGLVWPCDDDVGLLLCFTGSANDPGSKGPRCVVALSLPLPPFEFPAEAALLGPFHELLYPLLLLALFALWAYCRRLLVLTPALGWNESSYLEDEVLNVFTLGTGGGGGGRAADEYELVVADAPRPAFRRRPSEPLSMSVSDFGASSPTTADADDCDDDGSPTTDPIRTEFFRPRDDLAKDRGGSDDSGMRVSGRSRRRRCPLDLDDGPSLTMSARGVL